MKNLRQIDSMQLVAIILTMIIVILLGYIQYQIACIVSRPETESRTEAIDDCEVQVEHELNVDIKNYLKGVY